MSKNNKEITFYDIEELERIDASVKAKMSQEQLEVSREVDRQVDLVNQEISYKIDAENNLRNWAKRVVGATLTMTQLEDLSDRASAAKPGHAFVFTYQKNTVQDNRVATIPTSVVLFKNTLGYIDRVENYVFQLESTLIKNQQQYTEFGFFDLIKLAFKRLLKRS